MKSYVCVLCGYIHTGEEAPESCPVCGAPAGEFTLQEEEPAKKSGEAMNVVIIGSGVAGLSCAKEIRNHSAEANITLISKETLLPYSRVSLTRYLAGEAKRESLSIHSQEYYLEKRINLILGKEAAEIKKDSKEVQLNDGTLIPYDKLVIASGAQPFVPPITGKELPNVITVRTLEDADYLLDQIQQLESCICIGGGILGLETAGAIAKRGIKVTLLESAKWLMPRQLNKKGALLLKEYLGDIGIEVREGIVIEEIIGKEECEGIRLSTGEILPAKLVIVTAGVRPETQLAGKAGIVINKGITVNNNMETSEANIYAAGDVSEHAGILYGLWKVAQMQGEVAAQNILGRNAEFEGVPMSTILKVLGLDTFSIGEFLPEEGEFSVYEKELPGQYVLFVLRENKITGSIVMGDKTLPMKIKKAVETGSEFPAQLYDNADKIIEKLNQGI